MAAKESRAANRKKMLKHLELRKQENLTYEELSARTGVKVVTLARWQRVFKQERALATSDTEAAGSTDASPFLELVVGENPKSPSPPTRHFEITVANNQIKVPFDFDANALKKLIHTLRQAC